MNYEVSAMKKYLTTFLIFIVAIAMSTMLFLKNYRPEYSSIVWMIFIYFCVLSVAFHYGLVKSTESRPQVFVRYYMATTTIKLFLNLGILVIYSVLNKNSAIPFIISFMIFYFLFTVFEVAFTWKTIRR